MDQEHEMTTEEFKTNNDKQYKKKAVYSIIEREQSKSYWMRLGTAFINRDQSLTVYLNALPVNGKLHIRDIPSQQV